MARKQKRGRGRVVKQNPHKINREIKAHLVMLVGENGYKETLKFHEALKIAEDQELDLVMVGEKADPPVCKVMDYKKFLYHKEKDKKVQKTLKMKEVRFRPNTDENDYKTKRKQIIDFLEKGHKVKAFVFFKGREMAFKSQGEKLLAQLAVDIEEHGIPENTPRLEGRKMNIFFKSKKAK